MVAVARIVLEPAFSGTVTVAVAQVSHEPVPLKFTVTGAAPLPEERQRMEAGRRRGPQLFGDILPIVLARRGVSAVQSTVSGESDPHEPERAPEPRTPTEALGSCTAS